MAHGDSDILTNKERHKKTKVISTFFVEKKRVVSEVLEDASWQCHVHREVLSFFSYAIFIQTYTSFRHMLQDIAFGMTSELLFHPVKICLCVWAFVGVAILWI